jgi:anhydro-N-acetylmuramic acid kinase
MKHYKAIGLMSGTSLDGLDIAACEFTLEQNKWSYKICHSHTFPYPPEWHVRLSNLPQANAFSFALTNVEYGHLLGKLTKTFIEKTGFKPDLIASHGHTVFHQPGKALTVQIGAGSAIAAETGIPVICDFRSLDVALGGQGAPLVPIGDRLLFPEYDACLNLGGFANISMEHCGHRIAYDICPVNIVLNDLASRIGKSCDMYGEMARSGAIDFDLLKQLNQLEYYSGNFPKSLGREWVETELSPFLAGGVENLANLMRTFCEHVAIQINRSITGNQTYNILVTGGGTHNTFLMERIEDLSSNFWMIPKIDLVDFKEALVFAFLGVLRSRKETNVLGSVTGSHKNHSGGASFLA